MNNRVIRSDADGTLEETQNSAVAAAQGFYMGFTSCSVMLMRSLADVEAEDIDLGLLKQDDEIAGDVDDTSMGTELADDDADALDSDGAEDEELGIDKEESDSECLLCLLSPNQL